MLLIKLQVISGLHSRIICNQLRSINGTSWGWWWWWQEPGLGGNSSSLKGFADSRPFELLLSEVTGTYHSAFSNLKQLNIFYKFTPHCTVFAWGVTTSFLYYILTWICMIHVKQTAFASYDLGQLVTPEVYPQKKAIQVILYVYAQIQYFLFEINVYI